jgi:hypothetical protein
MSEQEPIIIQDSQQSVMDYLCGTSNRNIQNHDKASFTSEENQDGSDSQVKGKEISH